MLLKQKERLFLGSRSYFFSFDNREVVSWEKSGLPVNFITIEEVKQFGAFYIDPVQNAIFKSLQAGKNRWWHRARLNNKEDICGQLLER